jgi:hypothetical protein
MPQCGASCNSAVLFEGNNGVIDRETRQRADFRERCCAELPVARREAFAALSVAFCSRVWLETKKGPNYISLGLSGYNFMPARSA